MFDDFNILNSGRCTAVLATDHTTVTTRHAIQTLHCQLCTALSSHSWKATLLYTKLGLYMSFIIHQLAVNTVERLGEEGGGGFWSSITQPDVACWCTCKCIFKVICPYWEISLPENTPFSKTWEMYWLGFLAEIKAADKVISKSNCQAWSYHGYTEYVLIGLYKCMPK